MRRKAVCRFRNLPIEFDEFVQEKTLELGGSTNLPPESEFRNCSQYDRASCAKFGCLLDPTAGLGGVAPFQP
jgi:hypothetical protein